MYVCVFVSVFKSEFVCFILGVYNYPINLNLSLGTCSQRKSNESLYGLGACATCANYCAYVYLCSV